MQGLVFVKLNLLRGYAAQESRQDNSNRLLEVASPDDVRLVDGVYAAHPPFSAINSKLRTLHLTPLEPQSRFGDKVLEI